MKPRYSEDLDGVILGYAQGSSGRTSHEHMVCVGYSDVDLVCIWIVVHITCALCVLQSMCSAGSEYF